METADIEENLLHQAVLPKRPQRILGIDLFRGFIMIVMAWDHLKDQFVDLTMHGSETWQGEAPDFNNSIWFFLARAVSDICAPGFFFTMGVGMLYFTESRFRRGWSLVEINYYYLKRSIVLFIVGRIVNFTMVASIVLFSTTLGSGEINVFDNLASNLHWPEDWLILLELALGVIFQVMTALSLSMFFSSLLLTMSFKLLTPPGSNFEENRKSKESFYKKGAYVFIALCIGFFALSNAVIVHYEYGDARKMQDKFPANAIPASNLWEVFVRFALIPGALAQRSIAGYAAIPWIGLTCLGIALGFKLKSNPKRTIALMGNLSVLFAIGFVLVRLFGGSFGNIRGFPVGDGSSKDDDTPVNPVIEFFYTLKYPPSPAYALLTMSINFGLIWYLSKAKIAALLDAQAETLSTRGKIGQHFLKILLVLGNAPLFFYTLHFQVIAVFLFIKSLFIGYEAKIGLQYLPLIWVPLILILYPCCLNFIEFRKATHPDSYWRLV